MPQYIATREHTLRIGGSLVKLAQCALKMCPSSFFLKRLLGAWAVPVSQLPFGQHPVPFVVMQIPIHSSHDCPKARDQLTTTPHFTDPGGMEGWVNPRPSCAHGF